MAKKGRLQNLTKKVKKESKAKSNHSIPNIKNVVDQKSMNPLEKKSKSPKIVPYDVEDTILLVGEGNFSFAVALVNQYCDPHKIIATCFDSEKVLYEKYTTEATENVQLLKNAGVTVLFNIDATKLSHYKVLKNKRFSKIVFNFPHCGLGIKDQEVNIQTNQKLLSEFTISAFSKLTCKSFAEEARDGQIHITLKSGQPYDSWDIKKVLKHNGILQCVFSFKFLPELYKGYEHRRTLGFVEGLSKKGNQEITKQQQTNARTFVVVRKVDGDDENGTKTAATDFRPLPVKGRDRIFTIGLVKSHTGKDKQKDQDDDDDGDDRVSVEMEDPSDHEHDDNHIRKVKF